jgi:hypothetical protein
MLTDKLRATGPARRRSAEPAPMEDNSVTPYASLGECDRGGDTVLRLRADRKPALEASGGGIIRRQVLRLIREVLAEPDIEEEARSGLLRHLAQHPGDPELALLAHLSDWQHREDHVLAARHSALASLRRQASAGLGALFLAVGQHTVKGTAATE